MTDFKRELSQRDLQDRALPPQKGFANTPRPPTLVLAMKRFLRKTLLWLARTAAILIVLLILFYAEEDWRGARDWAAYQKELQAKGETLDLRQLAPPGNSEDDLSKVPLFTKDYGENFGFYVGFLGEETYRSPESDNRRPFQSTDLAAWQKFYRSVPEIHLPSRIGTPAQDVLASLSQFDGQLTEIEAAVNRPRAFWSIDYQTPLFSTSFESRNYMTALSKVYLLRAVAYLDDGKTALASKDFLASLNLFPPLARNCLPNNVLVIYQVQANSNCLLWEGLRRHAWDDTQLRTMESDLASLDLIALAAKSVRIDRAATLQMMNLYQYPSPEFLQLDCGQEDVPVKPLHRLSLIRPNGWWDQDRLRYSTKTQALIDGTDVANGRLSSSAFTEKVESSETYCRMIYTPISVCKRFKFSWSARILAKAETYCRLARIACRLEEYRIAKGQYPDSLEKLPDLPLHLNQEVLNERPFDYQRKGNGYLFYSFGLDGTDHGGNSHFDGDWVWPSP